MVKICIVGMGYVGLPLAVEFAKKTEVIGYEINEEKVKLFLSGKDPTHEVGDEVVKNTSIQFTSDASKIKDADFIIVAVPTPIDSENKPDLKYVKSASEVVGKNMSKDSIVVYESTVYPGVTEEECLPILEKESGFKLGEFGLGYSPERINPGDKEHRVDTIVKVVSGNNEEVLDKIAKTYELIIKAGVHKAPTIKVAESAKVIENIQRDLNIALMNELSIIFEKMDINTKDVIDAAATKWNFHKYTPGLVGGHCFHKGQLMFVKFENKFDILTSENLYELSKKEKNIEILSFNVDSKKSEFNKCIDSSKRKYSNLISFKTSTNQILKVTDDHPIIIWEKGFKVKHAKDVTLQDKFVVNTNLPEMQENKITKYFDKLNYNKNKGFLIIDLKEITKEETEYVYSFEVDKTKTIITDFGIIAHNCIGVDPYYLTYKAQQLGYKPEVILAGRKINDSMHEEFVRRIEKKYGDLKDKKIFIMGLTFKPNVPDFRNSRIKHLIDSLNKKGAVVYGHDPYITEEVKPWFDCIYIEDIEGDYDVRIIGTSHKEYETLGGERLF